MHYLKRHPRIVAGCCAALVSTLGTLLYLDHAARMVLNAYRRPDQSTTGATAALSSSAARLFERYDAEVAREYWEWLERDLFSRPVWTWSVEETDRVDRFLAQHADLIAAIRRIARAGKPVFAPDPAQGADVLLPHLVPLHHAGQLLAANAMAQARSGNDIAAAEDWLDSLRLAEVLRNEPFRASQEARSAMHADRFRRLGLAWPPGQIPPALGEQLTTWIATQDLAASWMGVWNLELSTAVTHALDLDSGTTLLGRLRLARVIQHDHQLTRMFRLPFHEFNPDSAQSLLPGMPGIAPLHQAMILHQARLRVVAWGIAVERWKQDHGKFPEVLQEVSAFAGGVPPVDPFTGDSLRYRVASSGITLYSIGPNRTDDGSKADDIAWRQ